jgi:hypothetical protein
MGLVYKVGKGSVKGKEGFLGTEVGEVKDICSTMQTLYKPLACGCATC